MAINVVTLTICGTGIFGVRGDLAAVSSIDGGRRTAECNIYLGIHMSRVVGDGHSITYCARMACAATYGIHLGRIYMSSMTAGGHDVSGGVIGLMTSFAGQTSSPGCCLVRCIKSAGFGSGTVTVRSGATAEGITLAWKIVIQCA